MDFRPGRPPANLIVHAIVTAGAILAIDVVASGVLAQTLTEPHPPARWAPHDRAAKPRADNQAKPCSAFGAGFVNVPGSDACIKIGGWVTVEGTTRAR